MQLLPYRDTLPTVHPSAFIAPGGVVIGDVHIGQESSIWFGCVLRGDVNHIRVGARTNLQDGTVVHVTRRTHPTLIGDDITIGHRVLLHGCTLHDRCFIGMGATLLDGVIVESEAMLAAGALVTPGKRIPAGELWGGTPARFMRALTDEDRRFFQANVSNYVELGREYLSTRL